MLGLLSSGWAARPNPKGHIVAHEHEHVYAHAHRKPESTHSPTTRPEDTTATTQLDLVGQSGHCTPRHTAPPTHKCSRVQYVCSPFRRLFAHAHACFPSVRSLDTRAHRGRSSRRRTLQGRCLRADERPARHEPSSPLRRWAPRRSRWAPGLPPPRPRARRS